MLPSDLPPWLANKIELQPDGCWRWTGAKHSRGYGHVKWEGKARLAHRVVWRVVHGVEPPPMLDHRCHDPARCEDGPRCPHRKCVNPAHLAGTTPFENVVVRSNGPTAHAARRTGCPEGHPYDYIDRDGTRRCRRCRNKRAREYRARVNLSRGSVGDAPLP